MTVDVAEERVGVRRPSVLAWLRLVHVFHKVERRAEEHLRAGGISMAQVDVIARVGADPGLTQQELANSLLVTKGNVCQLLDRMEAAGMIERRQDGRANHLYLTADGSRIFTEIVPCHEDLIAAQFEALTPEEQRLLLDLLRKLDQSLTWSCGRAEPRSDASR
ncbi:MAG TPA: MarR family winged helix-turn-helix transcriptional regulator [Chloroflexota bacterium]|nr:MarR family winged helix-turn-helix transcriptional regulator [Chloroflexota bacterium]